MLKFPKPTKKKKTRKPLNLKRKFKDYSNAVKTYKNCRTESEIIAYAERCRAQRLANRTPAEEALHQTLKSMGIEVEAEKIFYIRIPMGQIANFLLADLYCPQFNCVFELDGGVHNRTKGYDAGRDRYLASHDIRVTRFDNEFVLTNPAAVKQRIRELIRTY